MPDPDLYDETQGIERLRARLARTGLPTTATRRGERPDQTAFEAARAQAGAGTPLSEIVSTGRE